MHHHLCHLTQVIERDTAEVRSLAMDSSDRARITFLACAFLSSRKAEDVGFARSKESFNISGLKVQSGRVSQDGRGGFRRDGRELSTMLDAPARLVHGNGNGKSVNSSPRPRFQDGSLQMQKCEIPYNRSSRRREILNLGIPLGSRFSLSIPLVSSNLIPRIPLVFLVNLLVPRQPLVLSIRAFR